MSTTIDGALPHLICGAYKLYMSDGSQFPRKDIEPVYMNSGFEQSGHCPSLIECPRLGETGKHVTNNCDVTVASSSHTDDEQCAFAFHICKDEGSLRGPQVYNKCNVWDLLTESQQSVLTKVARQVNEDYVNGQQCTCIIIEGPGGCGKTRVLAHIMNHRSMNTLVLYVTKQNNRVQEFIHIDCLKGEPNTDVRKPIDLSSWKNEDILDIIKSNTVGGFALTTNKLVYALARLEPTRFNTDSSAESLGINYDVFYCNPLDDNKGGHNANNGTDESEGDSNRLIVIVVDEYGQHEPPLLHAITYYVKRYSGCMVVVIMGGDGQQCGPIGWENQSCGPYTNDVRKEFATKVKYDPLVLTMESLERCKGDPALAACIKRLRRLSKEATDTQRSRKKVMDLVLARYAVDSGVDLYRHGIFKSYNTPVVLKVVPVDIDRLDFDGSGLVVPTSATHSVSDEEYDENGVEYIEQPIIPQYDLLNLVDKFTQLYKILAVEVFHRLEAPPDTSETLLTFIGNIVLKWLQDVRHFFPLFIVVSNGKCNILSEVALLGIYVQLQERLLAVSVPDSLVKRGMDDDSWKRHLKYMLQRNVRYVRIDDDDPLKRQTLLVGMVYRMTCTTADDEGNSLCNGEQVVLTSILYNDNTLRTLEGIVVRKINRHVETDYMLRPGPYKNRLTNGQIRWVFPIVPLMSDTIYQMQGTTMSVKASSYIDLVNANCKNAYVAVSRFQNSKSIQGIIISD